MASLISSSGFQFISATPPFSAAPRSYTASSRPQCKRSGLFQPHSPDILPVLLPHRPDKVRTLHDIPLSVSDSPSHTAASSEITTLM